MSWNDQIISRKINWMWNGGLSLRVAQKVNSTSVEANTRVNVCMEQIGGPYWRLKMYYTMVHYRQQLINFPLHGWQQRVFQRKLCRQKEWETAGNRVNPQLSRLVGSSVDAPAQVGPGWTRDSASSR